MKQLMLGNAAIARGLYEAGCRFVSAYPGTPSTEITEFAAGYDEMYAEWAPNEKVAMESAFGASLAGARSFCAMKHVGLNVAADPAVHRLLHRGKRRLRHLRGRRPGHAFFPERAGFPALRPGRQSAHAGARGFLRMPGPIRSSPLNCRNNSTPLSCFAAATRVAHSQISGGNRPPAGSCP